MMHQQGIEIMCEPVNNACPAPQVLREDPGKSYGALQPGSEFDNKLILGDNLPALHALKEDYQDKIKLIYIDPPYNTKNKFTCFHDRFGTDTWLKMMKERLEIMRNLLCQNGTIWIQVDDNEAHYLKVLCDQLFGRHNFVANVVWQRKTAPQNRGHYLSVNHDHILVYAKNKKRLKLNLLPRSEKSDAARYKNPDNDPRGRWVLENFRLNIGITSSKNYPISLPSGGTVVPSSGRQWRGSKERFSTLAQDNRIIFKNHKVYQKVFLSNVRQGISSLTVWTAQEVGSTQESKKEALRFNSASVFDTPKPEQLLQRIIHLATHEGDLVLDAFAGSGTTGAVAHKMGRRWIMIEQGEQCDTHIVPRLKKVIDGEDEGGVTKAVNWKGGGGYRYYYLSH